MSLSDIAVVYSLLDGSIYPVLICVGPDFSWTPFLEDLRALSDSGDGLSSLYAFKAVRLVSMRGSRLAEVESCQSFSRIPFSFPKALRAEEWKAFFTLSHCSVEDRLQSPVKVEKSSVMNSAERSECFVLMHDNDP